MGDPAATVSIQVADVPEPAPNALLAAGLLSLDLRRRLSRVAP